MSQLASAQFGPPQGAHFETSYELSGSTTYTRWYNNQVVESIPPEEQDWATNGYGSGRLPGFVNYYEKARISHSGTITVKLTWVDENGNEGGQAANAPPEVRVKITSYAGVKYPAEAIINEKVMNNGYDDPVYQYGNPEETVEGRSKTHLKTLPVSDGVARVIVPVEATIEAVSVGMGADSGQLNADVSVQVEIDNREVDLLGPTGSPFTNKRVLGPPVSWSYQRSNGKPAVTGSYPSAAPELGGYTYVGLDSRKAIWHIGLPFSFQDITYTGPFFSVDPLVVPRVSFAAQGVAGPRATGTSTFSYSSMRGSASGSVVGNAAIPGYSVEHDGPLVTRIFGNNGNGPVGGSQLTPGDTASNDTLKFNFTWPDGVQGTAVRELILHPAFEPQGNVVPEFDDDLDFNQWVAIPLENYPDFVPSTDDEDMAPTPPSINNFKTLSKFMTAVGLVTSATPGLTEVGIVCTLAEEAISLAPMNAPAQEVSRGSTNLYVDESGNTMTLLPGELTMYDWKPEADPGLWITPVITDVWGSTGFEMRVIVIRERKQDILGSRRRLRLRNGGGGSIQ